MQILLDEYNEFIRENIEVIRKFESNSQQRLSILQSKNALATSEQSPQQSHLKRVKLRHMARFELYNREILKEYKMIRDQIISMGLEAAKHFPMPNLETTTHQSRFYTIAPRKTLVKLESTADDGKLIWSWHFRRRLWTIQRFSGGCTEFYPIDFETREEACLEIAKMVEEEERGCLEFIERSKKDQDNNDTTTIER